MERLVDFAREHEVVLVHDFAYADLGFDGYEPPSILQVPGAKDVAVEIYTMTKSFSMAGWRVGFVVGNQEIVQALTKLKTYLDYGTFQPIQIAAIVAMNEAPDYPKEINEIYRSRRDALCDGLNRIGWHLAPPKGTMFVWAPDPRALPRDGLARVLQVPGQRGRRGHVAGRGLRPGRRRPRALRPHRERAAHRPGRAQPAQRARPSWADGTERDRSAPSGSRQAGARHGRPHLLDRAVAGRPCLDGVAVERGDQVERAAVVVAEHAGEAVHRRGHALEDLAALGDAHALGRQRVGHPDGAVGAQADAVGGDALERGPHASVGQRAVVGAVERGEAAAHALGDDRACAPSSVMTVPLGNWRSAAASWLVPSGSTRTSEAGAMALASTRPVVEAVEVEAEVARVGLAVGRHHHVVGVPGGPGPAGRRARTSVPSGSRRMMTRSRRELNEEAPVGQPAQTGRLAVEVAPRPGARRRARPRRRRGRRSPSTRGGRRASVGTRRRRGPETNGSAVRVSLVTVAPPGRAGSGTAVQHRRRPVRAAARRGYLGPVTYWVLKAILTPIFFVLFRVKVEGRENIPKHGPGRAGGQPPVLLRLLLHPPGGPAQGDLPGQGGVLRLVEDGVVLPGRRADPDPAHRRQRLGAGPRDGAHRRARARVSILGLYPEGTRSTRPVRAQGTDRA